MQMAAWLPRREIQHHDPQSCFLGNDAYSESLVGYLSLNKLLVRRWLALSALVALGGGRCLPGLDRGVGIPS